MKKKVMEKWVKALRSGDYKQGTHRLQKDGNFCCLGVLCEVLKVPKTLNIYNVYSYGIGDDVSTGHLPKATMKLSGMQSRVGTIEFPEAPLNLTILNDVRKRSFKHIAAFIERNWEKL